MPLYSFSIPKHIHEIKSGRKHQTTRYPRKNSPKPGQMAYLRYKSRMGKCCGNCVRDCEHSEPNGSYNPNKYICFSHTNLFGVSPITKVIRLPSGFTGWSHEQLEEWAVNDGFESFEEADEWFTECNGPDWMSLPWEIVIWDPEPVRAIWKQATFDPDDDGCSWQSIYHMMGCEPGYEVGE